eukprot:superscaffoldBa00000259_g3281
MATLQPPQPPSKAPNKDFTAGLLAKPRGSLHPRVICPKMESIFNYMQHEWASPLTAKPLALLHMVRVQHLSVVVMASESPRASWFPDLFSTSGGGTVVSTGPAHSCPQPHTSDSEMAPHRLEVEKRSLLSRLICDAAHKVLYAAICAPSPMHKGNPKASICSTVRPAPPPSFKQRRFSGTPQGSDMFQSLQGCNCMKK